MFWGIRGTVAAAALAFVVLTSTAEASFSATGSVEQVYVTGLTPGAKAMLFDRAGKALASRRANTLGGLLFRDVRPGTGYRVGSGATKSGPLTVLTTRPA